MRQLNFNYVVWYANKTAKKIGVFGLLALAIALGCCLFYMLNVIPLKQQVELAQADAQKSKLATSNQLTNQPSSQSANKIAQQPAQPVQATVADIARFYAQFPAGESLPKWLRLIDKTASQQGLVLNRGDYKLTQIKQLKTMQGELARYEIVLPVTGQYVQIRQFIAQVLLALPALALSDLQIKRENVQSQMVEARLVFVLLLQGDSWQ